MTSSRTATLTYIAPRFGVQKIHEKGEEVPVAAQKSVEASSAGVNAREQET
jgi:hypothetical protein